MNRRRFLSLVAPAAVGAAAGVALGSIPSGAAEEQLATGHTVVVHIHGGPFTKEQMAELLQAVSCGVSVLGVDSVQAREIHTWPR